MMIIKKEIRFKKLTFKIVINLKLKGYMMKKFWSGAKFP